MLACSVSFCLRQKLGGQVPWSKNPYTNNIHRPLLYVYILEGSFIFHPPFKRQAQFPYQFFAKNQKPKKKGDPNVLV